MPAKGNHWRPPLRIFANQPTRSLWPLLHPNFISNYHWSMPIKHCVFSSVFNVKAPVCSRHFQPGEGSMSFLCLWMFHEPLFEALMVAWWCAEQDAGPAMWPWLGVTSPAAQPSPAQETVHCQPAATSRDLLSTASPPFTCHRDVSRQSMQAQSSRFSVSWQIHKYHLFTINTNK